jgi:hypothetical protein
MLASTARFEKLLDDLPKHVANVNGLNRNLYQTKSVGVEVLCCDSPLFVLIRGNHGEETSG